MELGAAGPELHRFTFPRYRPLLAQLGDAKDPTAPFALCASIGEQPAGLALFARVFDPSRGSLLSVMVDPLLRRRGGYSSTPWDRMTEEDRRELASVVARDLPKEARAMNPLELPRASCRSPGFRSSCAATDASWAG